MIGPCGLSGTSVMFELFAGLHQTLLQEQQLYTLTRKNESFTYNEIHKHTKNQTDTHTHCWKNEG